MTSPTPPVTPVDPAPTTSLSQTLTHSYLFLRRFIGAIGLLLPWAVIVGKLIVDGGGLEPSISDYYYTDMRGLFVGSMCSIGVFLLSYYGYTKYDNLASNVAGCAAIGLALFPTVAPVNPNHFVGGLHLFFAGVFFLTLVVFCMYFFVQGGPVRTPQKAWRNLVYRTCGVAIMLCLVLAAVSIPLLPKNDPLNAVLWLEAIAIFAFGVSWFVKGETLLRDRPTAATLDTALDSLEHPGHAV